MIIPNTVFDLDLQTFFDDLTDEQRYALCMLDVWQLTRMSTNWLKLKEESERSRIRERTLFKYGKERGGGGAA